MTVKLVKIISDLAAYFKYSTDDEPTTVQKFIALCKNHGQVLIGLSKMQWQPTTEMALNQIVWSPNMGENIVAKVTAVGITGESEPAWGEVDSTVNDGGVTYVMCQHITTPWTETGIKTVVSNYITTLTKSVIAQIMYPKNSVISFADDTNPNNLWSGMTWEKFAQGRTLVGAGTYSDSSGSYTYTVGATGGEAKHKLSVSELASHNHSGTTSATSHNHSFLHGGIESGGKQSGISLFRSPERAWLDGYISGGSHTHSVTVGNTGNNGYHENRPPYVVVTYWKRTA